jgi:hypothetical protein
VRRLAGIAAALAAAWVLSGCAAMRLAYDNADAFVRWRAGNYLDLQGEQAQDLEQRIQAFHHWHRSDALPQYEKLALEAARRLDAGLSPGDLVWGYDSLKAQASIGLREAATRIAPLLDRLDPSQLAHIERGFAEDNRRFAREFLRGNEKERRARRVKRTVERLEDWVGRLSEPQMVRVRQFAERAAQADELRDRERRRLQAALLDIVRRREAQARLADLAGDWERGRDPGYAAAAEANRRELYAMLLDLDRMLTPRQRAHAVARLKTFADDFRALNGAARRAN